MTAKKKRRVDSGRVLRQTVTFILVLIFTLTLLTLLHLASSGVILRREEAWQTSFFQRVMPDATVFTQVRFEDERVDDVQAAYAGSTLLGYCVTVTAEGFRGPMVVVTGVSTNGEVTGVTVVSHNESALLGDGIEDAAFLSRFVGGTGTLHVGAGRNGVAAVTGATESSRAVVEGVNAALSCVANLDTEGGDDLEGEV